MARFAPLALPVLAPQTARADLSDAGPSLNPDLEVLVKPGLLVASPQLINPFFGRTVILLWEHNEEGAMGAVINRSLGIDVDAVLSQLHIPAPVACKEPVLWGGPVDQEIGFLIFRDPCDADLEGAIRIHQDLWVSSSRVQLERAAQGELRPPFLLCLGYAGWAAGQLDEEIRRGSWIVLDLDMDLILNVGLERRWDRGIGSLGIQAEQIWMSHAVDE